MNRVFVSISLLVLLSVPLPRGYATVRYVDDSAPPGGNGLSWATASNNLFTTLLAASAGDEIHVGTGTYKPTPASSQNTAYFALHDGMILRGGYAGYGATNPDDQNPAFTTTLSGDLNGNDGPSFSNRSDNAYHVVKIAANTPPSTAACVIDSFTIIGGNAVVGGYPVDRGGAVHATGPSVISRCVFRDNYGIYGGAMFADKSAQVSDCTFELNKAQYSGGAIELTSAALAHTFRRCTFRGNVAGNGSGGAVDFYYSYPLFVGCTFAGNQASGFGGAIRGSYYPLTCINCGFFGNTSGGVGGGVWVEMAGTLTGCVFSGNTATSYAGAANGIAEMYNCTVVNNHSNGSSSGGIQAANSVTVRNSILWGNSDPASGSGQFAQMAVYGSITISNSTVQGWTGSWGGTANNGTDPLFVLPAGNDGTIGTDDDNLRLAVLSPALDSGNNASVPADTGDVDSDGDTAETLPLDIDGNPRIGNDASVLPDANVVNRGAYENDHAPPHIIAWRSVRSHGAPPNTSLLSILLDPAASGNGLTGPTTEPRNSGIRRIEIDFSDPVQLKTGGSVSVTGWFTNGSGQISGPFNLSGSALRTLADADTLRLDFSSLPDRACITIDVTNSVVDAYSNPVSGDKDCTVRTLRGDETSSGDLTLSDAIREQTLIGLPLSAFPGSDYNLDGVLDATDVQSIKSLVHSPAYQALCP